MTDKTFGITKPIESTMNLTSMAPFFSLITQIIKTSKVSSVCEIGVEKLIFSKLLINFCHQENIIYNCIDPSIDDETLSELYKKKANIYKLPSHKAISKLSDIDLYIIDGDHNYYTVSKELELILETSKNKTPIILLHDIAWPTDYRDAYYLPSYIPANEIHSYSTNKCVSLKNDKLVSNNGIKASKRYAWRKNRGNNENGVKLAVEDFLVEHKQLKSIFIPGFYGLGIIYSPSTSSNMQLSLFSDIETSSKIFYEINSTLEYSRLNLLSEYYSLETSSNKLIREKDDSISSLEKLVIEKNNAIKNLESLVIEKDNSIKSLESLVIEKDNAVAATSKLVDERDEYIKILENR